MNFTEVQTHPGLVSVITIFLNAEKFIRDAIQSVFLQTYSHWELLLVDDGSSDASTQIARGFAEEYPNRVRYLEHASHKNQGMSASRNLGISHAKGSYIAFLDSDDVWQPEKLEHQVTILGAQPQAALVCGPVQWWYSWTEKPGDVKRDFITALNVRPEALVEGREALVSLLQNETVTTTASLLRRDAVIEAGGFEESFRGLYEDQACFAKICSRRRIYVTGICSYKWRKHADSSCLVGLKNNTYRSARLAFLLWLKKYLSEHKISDGELSSVLKTQVRECHRSLVREAVFAMIRHIKNAARRVANRMPSPVRHWLGARLLKDYVPPVGQVRFGDFRRSAPFSREWGMDRGLPVDRYYIEKFLQERSADVMGRVLEVGDNRYTRRFGNAKVIQSDVLHVLENPQATIVADLTRADNIPSGAFDCVICTQTLLVIYDIRAAIRTLYRILKADGVLLVSIPGVSHAIARFDMDRWGDYWRFTSLSARLLFEEVFPPSNVSVKAQGNVLAATAFLNGLAAEDLSPQQLDHWDPDYEVTITVRAVKPRS